MDIHSILLIIGTALALCAPFFYAYDIFKGKARPQRTTRLIILIITSVAFASLLAQENQVALWLAATSVFQALVIFILSIKYGVGGWGKLDFFCLGIAGVGILIWKLTNNPILGLYAAILADFTGMIPTFIKTYRQPQTESFAFFLLNTFSPIFNFLAIYQLTLNNVSYPIYVAVVNLTVLLLIIRPKLKSI